MIMSLDLITSSSNDKSARSSEDSDFICVNISFFWVSNRVFITSSWSGENRFVEVLVDVFMLVAASGEYPSQSVFHKLEGITLEEGLVIIIEFELIFFFWLLVCMESVIL